MIKKKKVFNEGADFINEYKILFMPQCINWFQQRSFPGRVPTEKYSNK